MVEVKETDVMALKRKHYFSTLDIVYFAILGMMGGVISSYVPIVDLLKNVLPPPNPLPQLLGGHHLIWMVLAFGVTGKHGAAASTAVIKGILEFMVGDRLGPIIILLNLLEGISIELGFYITRSLRRAGKVMHAWGLAGGIGNVTQPPFFWLFMGRLFIFPAYFVVLACVFAFVSGIFISGLLSLSVLRFLEKAGIGQGNPSKRGPGPSLPAAGGDR